MKEKIKNEKGITLIALVITIIILLILAGVTINVAIGDNGLFKKSQKAVEKYKEAERNETEVLESMSDEIAKIDILKKVTGNETVNTPVTIDGQNVWIPAGFKISEETAGEVRRGIVVEDKNGNQFVWVPCYVPSAEGETEIEKEAKTKGYPEFNRYDFGKQLGNYSDYSAETVDSIQLQYDSIKTYGGFYIGRFEAGDKETTALGKLRGEEGTGINTDENTGDITKAVVIKKNQAPYNYVTQTQCVELSNNFARDNGYNLEKMFTVLCSSYAWDTTVKFIEKTNAGYATNSPQGNYKNHKFSNSEWLINTGLTKAVCNIYDMGGNLWEYTTESYSHDISHYCERGGAYYHYDYDRSAGYRDYCNGWAYSIRGFRPTLFLKA